MRWTREQFLGLMTGERVERPMFVELFGPLIGLPEEWRGQGASAAEIDLTAFDFDYVPVAWCGGHTGLIGMPEVVLREDDEMLVKRDYLGRTAQLCKRTATIALPLDFPVKSMDDWLKVKPMFTFSERRIDWAAVERAREQRGHGHLVIAGISGAFDVPRELMGEEAACMAYYDQPELMHEILATLSDTAFRVLEPISRRVQIDYLSVHEDFAGRAGPLVGPAQIGEHFAPYYRRVWNMLRARGARMFQQDTDGNINPVIDALLATGLTSLYPMEPAAGMDVVALRQRYPKLMMMGGIDKHVLRRSKAEIRAELEYKLQPLMRDAGHIAFGLDHRIPNGTPLENYRYYVGMAREILGLPPAAGKAQEWARMAF